MRPSSSAPIQELERWRLYRHRLTPDRALKTLAQARRFLDDVGLAVLTPHTYLPSIFGAAQGEPFKPGVGGFGDWPAHAWWWGEELEKQPDVVKVKVLKGRWLYVAKRLWPIADAAIRSRDHSPTGVEQLVMALLRDSGRLRSDELDAMLQRSHGVTKASARTARNRLENLGLLISRGAVVDNHRHVSILETWANRFPTPLTGETSISGLVGAVMAAVVYAPAMDFARLFAWPRTTLAEALDVLVKANAITRRGQTLVSTAP